MHPADQVQAFGALGEAGVSVADIAARFGVPERTVEQRLRLGNAAPELLDDLRMFHLSVLDRAHQAIARQHRLRCPRCRQRIKEQGG